MKKIITLAFSHFIAAITLAQVGLPVGDQAPNFSGIDQNGITVNLSNALKQNRVVLIFYRGYWCPNCSRAVKSLQDSLQLLTRRKVSVIAVSPEGVEGVAKTVEKSGASFSVLSDEGLNISKAYKVAFRVTADMDSVHKKYGIDVEGNNGKNGAYLPRPAAYIISQDGKITYRYINSSPYSDPNSNNRVTVIELLENL